MNIPCSAIRAKYSEVGHICSVLTALIVGGRQLSLVTTIDLTDPERPGVATQILANFAASEPPVPETLTERAAHIVMQEQAQVIREQHEEIARLRSTR